MSRGALMYRIPGAAAALASALLGAGSLAAPAPSARTVSPGAVFIATGFEKPEQRAAWSADPRARWVGSDRGSMALRVSVPAGSEAESHLVAMPLDLGKYRGCTLLFECLAKAEGVSKPPQTYLGVKYMLHYQSNSGPLWKNEDGVYGTFGWKKLRFTAPISLDAEDGSLSLGLQSSSGTVWFDDLRVTVVKPPRAPRPQPPINPPPAYKGHNLPRLRGVMSPNEFRDEDLRVLGQEWKANLIRWQLTSSWGKPGTDRDLVAYDRWLDGKLDELDKVLVACKRYGIKAVIDLHTPSGGRYPNMEMALFQEPLYQDHFVKTWQRIAKRYKGNPAVWAYDLVNEPVQETPSPEGVADYLGAQVNAARAIRAIDRDTTILIESSGWDSAEAYKDLDPVDVARVVYQVHMYVPHQFTHQGVSSPSAPIAYPGVIDGVKWDKEQLRKVLQPVREFQLAYNVHIYCGEFSAIRWAPGDSAYRYLKDCIDLFEEYGWDWSYHAYREWDGWSVEHGPDPNDHTPTPEPTDRKKLLLSWFAKNVKP